MAGHNKWSKIKHQKGAQDKKRGALFSKVAKEIVVAVKLGGENPDNNFRLRSALDWAKSVNLPGENIKRAVTKGLGQETGTNFEELIYEGFGPGNVALIVECLSDNRNRSVSSVRHIFAKNHGIIGAPGSTKHLFDQLGLIWLDNEQIEEEALLELAIEAGAIDIKSEAQEYLVLTKTESLKAVYEKLNQAELKINSAMLGFISNSSVALSEPDLLEKNIKLISALEEDEDVKMVYSNLDYTPELNSALK